MRLQAEADAEVPIKVKLSIHWLKLHQAIPSPVGSQVSGEWSRLRLLDLIDEGFHLLLGKAVEQFPGIVELGVWSRMHMKYGDIEIVDLLPRLVIGQLDVPLDIVKGTSFVELDDVEFGGVAEAAASAGEESDSGGGQTEGGMHVPDQLEETLYVRSSM